MRGLITLADGSVLETPVLLEWRFTHAADGGADAFEVTCCCDSGMRELLPKAVGFRAEEAGKMVFTGFIDECEMSLSGAGALLSISGRGPAAILMDNEARAGEYERCSIEDILREHVRPWDITDIEYGPLKTISNYSVTGGKSEWDVLREFSELSGGGEPRFSKEGALLIGADSGRLMDLTKCGVLSVRYRESRYGVISEVHVIGRTNGRESVVYNGDFIDRGGRSRRMIYVPNKTRYDAMRYTGEYQIERSERDAKVIFLELAEPFAAFAGDHAEIYSSALGISGRFYVRESESWACGEECGITLELISEK
ncbi:MAG: hypothetical protein ACI3VB_05050 [Oscillospiraceae bacterium]